VGRLGYVLDQPLFAPKDSAPNNTWPFSIPPGAPGPLCWWLRPQDPKTAMPDGANQVKETSLMLLPSALLTLSVKKT
jgi:hypothetical protein